MDADDHVRVTERLIQSVEIVAAYVLVFLFAVGVFDLGLNIAQLVRTGAITQTSEVVALIDTVLLLFIIVEIYQTVVAYTREESVVRIVIITGIIAVTRRVISFHPGDHAAQDALLTSLGFAALLAVLVGSLYVVRRTRAESSDLH
ncbi:phosphate-starvation-inducible PsiE family protein [Halobacterium sp. CBA1126]|uniref:phosphate-starvation-inducible PsiE family protein n=1 Tax=Halobacterium TaxID=2239 RepID=UPI0012FC9FAD|nr:phosphate-starvation-inducible PsiE family protein [Halobacterium sp. CBA1126]MUV59726.1 hypothetical protein [Halobacterium sp. CBA1126]